MARRNAPSTSSRLEHIIKDPSADVLIIGGGINGISTFRDLALQGVKVVLVEKNDFCSGASSASSHMIHGGIRYLENGEIRLVRESLVERNRLLANAPHYVKPLPTTIPIFSLFSGLLTAPLRLLFQASGAPRERGAILIKIGLVLYDLFGRNAGQLPRHEFLRRRKSLARFPKMNAGVKFTAHYFDAAIESPERLAVELLLDGEKSGSHARSANYLEAVALEGRGVTLRDRLTGDEFSFRPQVIVNTSGPWTDQTNRALGIPSHYLGGTKGSHIVLDNPDLFAACDNREIFFENSDGRIVLMYPLLSRVIVGTTDIPINHPDEAVCTEEEVDYFFDLASHVFPGITLQRSQIVYRYSGVRPLPAAGDINPGVISRDYRVVTDSAPGGNTVISLIGGKWTTFRALGEHLTNDVLSRLGKSRVVSTVRRAIGGGRDFPVGAFSQAQWVTTHQKSLPAERAHELLIRYGTLAERVIEDIIRFGDEPLTYTAGYSSGEVLSLASREKVVSLSDLTHRRTPLAFIGAISPQSLEELASVIGEFLGWSRAEQRRQVELVVSRQSALPRSSRAPREKTTASRKTGIKH